MYAAQKRQPPLTTSHQAARDRDEGGSSQRAFGPRGKVEAPPNLKLRMSASKMRATVV